MMIMMDEIVIDEQKQIQIFLPQFMRCTDLVLVYVMVMIMNINIKQITTLYTHHISFKNFLQDSICWSI